MKTIVSLALATLAALEAWAEADSLSVQLPEVDVAAALVRHDKTGDSYLVTADLKRGAASTLDVLSRLPGVDFSDVSGTLSVRSSSDVKVIIGGVEASLDYLRALPIDRLKRIDVSYLPPARYTSAGVRYLITVTLRSDYTGHSLYVGNFLMASAGDNNGDNPIANEQPSAQYICSLDKVDITAGYHFGTIHWNYPVEYQRDYLGVGQIKSARTSTSNPNDLNATLSHSANLGVDWHLNPMHTLSARAQYGNDRLRHTTAYDVTESGVGTYHETAGTRNRVNELSTAIIYQGQIGDRGTLYGALAYNRMRNNAATSVAVDDASDAARYRHDKRLLRAEIDASYSLRENLLLNLGYRATENRYTTLSRDDASTLLRQREWRHNYYAYLDWTPAEQLILHMGLLGDAINRHTTEGNRTWHSLLPQFTLAWQPAENVAVQAEYSGKMLYPSLYELSTSTAWIDSRLQSVGNPALRPALQHQVSLQATLLDGLILGAEYTDASHLPALWWQQISGTTYQQTYVGARSRNLTLQASYNWAITRVWSWENTLQWQRQWLSAQGLTGRCSNLLVVSKMQYWISRIALMAKIEYRREMQNDPLLQGRQSYGQDLWQITLQKGLLKNQLFITLGYVPPVHCGVRTAQQLMVHTDFMSQSQSMNLRTYDNLLLLRVQWWFNKGRNKRHDNPTYDFPAETPTKDRGLL